MDITVAKEIVGGLSKPSKMPSFSYSIPAKDCKVGSRLREVEGSVCHKCYAMKGFYRMPVIANALERRLQAIRKPEWAEAMATLINNTGNPFFRWHDSGDLQDMEHLLKIIEVCKLTPNVKHWLPTREIGLIIAAHKAGVEFPENLVIRVSAPMIDGNIPRIKGANVVYSGVHRDTPAEGIFDCPARNQGNKCLDCRACWNSAIEVVSYHYH